MTLKIHLNPFILQKKKARDEKIYVTYQKFGVSPKSFLIPMPKLAVYAIQRMLAFDRPGFKF